MLANTLAVSTLYKYNSNAHVIEFSMLSDITVIDLYGVVLIFMIADSALSQKHISEP